MAACIFSYVILAFLCGLCGFAVKRAFQKGTVQRAGARLRGLTIVADWHDSCSGI
jgi:hypothetical protein